MTRKRMMSCGSHGEMPWEGEVICALDMGGCGRLYKMEVGHELACPDTCECGKPMNASVDSPLMPVCASCFDEHKPQLCH